MNTTPDSLHPNDPAPGGAAHPARGKSAALAALLAAAALGACSRSEPQAPPAPTPAAPTAAATTAAAPAAGAKAAHDGAGIAWRHASTVAEVDAAFAQAKQENKPVFVYWGAQWCPPCNQVKATLFNRHDFIERSKAFVPVYVDGDSPGAQKVGARYKVSGYPTMVLFNPQGTELTRLPGEVEASRYTEVLTLGMNAQRPVKEVLADAQAGGQALGPNDWRLLAFYSWDTDEAQLAPKAQLPALLKQLATACPADQVETATRLRLKAWIAAEDTKDKPTPTADDQAKLLALLKDPAASRAHMDVLANYATDLVKAVSADKTPARTEIAAAMDAALKRFEADTTLSRADRIGALIAQVDLAKLDGGQPSEALKADVRARAAQVDREITDGYERQAVITAAAYLLGQAGLDTEADDLLKANLAKSHSPYYLMSSLASNAKKRGDTAAALDWYQQAFDKSEGPATRLQWGASYVNALVELAPKDEPRIEAAAGQLFKEAATQPDAFDQRSGRSLQRIGAKLQAWNKDRSHQAALGRLQQQLDGVCAGLPADDPNRAACSTLLKPAKNTSGKAA